MRTQVVRKQRLAECQLHSGNVALRVVVSREVDAECAADVVEPKHVRIQQRRSMLFVSNGFGPAPTWSIDVAMVWSGASKSEAERKQAQADAPQYCLEVELVDSEYVARHDDSFVACSLVLKAADFLPPDASHNFFLPEV